MKKLYWSLEFEDISLIMSLSKLIKWVKDDVGDLERECLKSYRITPVWLTTKEINELKEAGI